MKKLKFPGLKKAPQGASTTQVIPAVEPSQMPKGKTPAMQIASEAQPKHTYASTFLRRNCMKTRQCVYISYDVHDVVARLVRSLTDQGQEVTIGGYIDTVLSEHLQTNRDEINELYRQRNGDLL